MEVAEPAPWILAMLSTAAVLLLLAGAPVSVHDFTVKTIDGAEVPLSRYKGLEEPYQAYGARGLEVLAFPSNDVGGQEPGTNAEIKKFRELRHKTTFPLFAKIAVKGKDAAPLYRYLTTLPVNGGAVVAHLDSSVEPVTGTPGACSPKQARILAIICAYRGCPTAPGRFCPAVAGRILSPTSRSG